MVYDGILLGLIVGFFRGGLKHGLNQFAALKLRSGWIFPVLLLIQFFIFYLQERFEWVASINGYLFAAVYITGLAFLWLNRHHTGFMLIWIGVMNVGIFLFIQYMMVSRDKKAVQPAKTHQA